LVIADSDFILSIMRLALMVCLIASTATAQFAFRTNDVIAFLGGTDVVTAQQSGHLEPLALHTPALVLCSPRMDHGRMTR